VRADIDVNGHFIGAIPPVIGFGPFACPSIDVTQSGSSLSLTAQCDVFGPATFTAAGTFDVMTGALHATGQGSIFCTTPGSLVIDGTATPDGYRIFASLTCAFATSLAATRCGNGILDAGESQACDDAAAAGLATFAFPGCCTDLCTLQPGGTSCASGGPGGECDAPDHCDGSSPLCADTRAANGTPCNDFNPCTTGDACLGGACFGGPPAPAGTSCVPFGFDDPCVDALCDSAGICQILFTTDPCDDGDACTTDDTCADGYCYGGPPVTCAPCLACDSELGCIPAVAQGCKRPLAPKSRLAISDSVPDSGDRLTWKWSSGEATSPDEFGDPLTADDYALCVFDQQGGEDHLVMSAVAPHGANWLPNARGFKYKDASLMPDGLQSIALKAGDDGKAKITVKGRGANLGLPAILSGITPPVTVQLLGPGGACWDAAYAVPQTSTPVSLKARGGTD
jgi:hypothetical protein